MKKRVLALLVAFIMLTGCSSMLNREFVNVEPHDQFSETGKDSSALRAETYQGLVNAILYLISQGSENGVIRLYNYTRDVEADLNNACLEVTTEDPFGAYAVDFIKYDFSRIVSYYEAKVQITYRRTISQMKSVASVTGSSAIKEEIRGALEKFSPEVVLRVSYFAEDEEYLVGLVRDAYYDSPDAAFGMPKVSVALYPDSGYQRIVELTLSYPETLNSLRQKHASLSEAAESFVAELPKKGDLPAVIYALLRERVYYQGSVREGYGTAYAALVGQRADSEGLALAFHLLCQLTGVESTVVYGTRNRSACYWNMVNTETGWRHVDVTSGSGLLLTDGIMLNAGYAWDAGVYPACVITEASP